MVRVLILGMPLAVCLAVCLRAEIVDRVAIYSGTQVITEQQLDESMRVTAFLNRAPVVRSTGARRAAAARLIDQMLVEREMRLNRYPLPAAADVDKYFNRVKKEFGTDREFEEELAKYDITDAVLRSHLALQLTLLRFVDYRFRPEAAVSSSDISKYYRANLRAWAAEHGNAPPPSLSAVSRGIRSILTARQADKAMDDWLKENRKQMHLVYLDDTLEQP